MATIKTTVHNRRIDVAAPSDIPDGAEVTLTIVEGDEGPLAPDEIAYLLVAMQRLEPLEIPYDVAAELDEWERKINRRGIEHRDPSLDDVFP